MTETPAPPGRAIAGALVMAAAGTARITQLRQHMRRDRRNSQAS
jgi:uncharacterized integral membrane protein